MGAGPRSGRLVEVDSGHHRTGVVPEEAGAVAAAAERAGLDVLGRSPSRATATPLAAAESLRAAGSSPAC